MPTLRTRRIVAIIFVITFFIITPILILYSSGYRYNFKKNILSKTGSLVIETTPRGASITLNNEQKNLTTPLRMNNLPPNEYFIQIQKTGFYPWQKTLPVYSQQTTFAEDIILFKQSQPQTIAAEQIIAPQIADNKNGLLYQTINNGKKQLTWLNLTDANPRPKILLEFASQDSQLIRTAWSNNSQYLLYSMNQTASADQQTLLVALNELAPQPITHELLNDPRTSIIVWDGQKNQTLQTLTNQTVYELTIQPEWKGLPNPITSQAIYTFQPEQKILDFLVYQNTLYYLEEQTAGVILTKHSLDTAAPPQLYPQIQVNANGDYHLESIISNTIILRDQASNKIYFINTDLTAVLLEKQDLLGYDYSAADNRLLLFDDTELQIVNLTSGGLSPETLTRTSQGITYGEWHPLPNYVMYVQNARIILIELDNRDLRNILTLPPTEVAFAALDAKGKNIYFGLKTGGLYRLPIIQ